MIPKSKNSGEGNPLEDLDVDRVDGVDDPATKRRFLMLKSMTGDEVAAAFERGEVATRSLLKGLAGVALPPDIQRLATAMAKSADLDVKFEVKKEESAPAPAAPSAPSAPAPAPAPAPVALDPVAFGEAVAKSFLAKCGGAVPAPAPVQKSDIETRLAAIESAIAGMAMKGADNAPPADDMEEDDAELTAEQLAQQLEESLVPKSASASPLAKNRNRPIGSKQVVGVKKGAPKIGEGVFTSLATVSPMRVS